MDYQLCKKGKLSLSLRGLHTLNSIFKVYQMVLDNWITSKIVQRFPPKSKVQEQVPFYLLDTGTVHE